MNLENLKDKVTIVIPCKNEEKYIGYLLDSLINQNLNGVKIIIADANSTDNTVDIIKSYKKLLNIKVIEGGPVSVGRNNGAKLVKTPYILFLDADVRFFSNTAIKDAVTELHENSFDLITLNMKNYGNDIRASLLFSIFNVINKIMTKKTPFAIGAFFLTRRDKFEQFGGFPCKYETSEDYILSKQYSPKKFKIVNHYFGQDERRFKKLGYVGMVWYMTKNFFNRHNLEHFERNANNINYWEP